MEKQLVVFDLGKEHYGMDILAVDGIIKMQEITSVPLSLKFVVGVTNLRGEVLPIIDLRKRLGLEEHEETNDTRIIVVNLDSKKIGMIVDEVSEVLTISDEDIDPTPPIINTVNTSFITGIAKVDKRLITLLDLRKVLSSEEVSALGKY